MRVVSLAAHCAIASLVFLLSANTLHLKEQGTHPVCESDCSRTELASEFVGVESEHLPDNVDFFVERNKVPKSELLVAIIPKGTSIVGPEFELHLGDKELFNTNGSLSGVVVASSGFSVFKINLEDEVVIDDFAWAKWQESLGKKARWSQAPQLSIQSCDLTGK